MSVLREKESEMEQSRSDSAAEPGCLRRFCGELKPCQPWFLVQDSNGRTIDIAASFAPAGCLVILWKLIVIGALVYTIIRGIDSQKGTAFFYLAYLTNWALLLSLFYAVSSLVNSLYSSKTPQPSETASFRIRATWVLFELGSHSGLIAILIFWLLIFQYDSKPGFLALAGHGIMAALVLLDGLVVNRIPVRLTHYWGFVLPFDIMFGVWTYLHSYFDIGNPNEQDNDPTTNDDAIYPVLDWKHDPTSAITFLGVLIFGVGPVVYMLLWMFSIYTLPCCCVLNHRRYVGSDDAAYLLA